MVRHWVDCDAGYECGQKGVEPRFSLQRVAFCRHPRIWHGNSLPRSLQNMFCYNVDFEWPVWRSEKQMSKDQPSYNLPTFKSVNLSEKVQLPSWIGRNWKHPEKQCKVVKVCSPVFKLYISVLNFLSQLSFVKCFMRKKKPQFPHLQNHDNIILHRQEVLWVLRDITWKKMFSKCYVRFFFFFAMLKVKHQNTWPLLPQNCQGHQNQGDSEKLSQPRRAYGYMTSKCNISWMGSWNRKKTYGKN